MSGSLPPNWRCPLPLTAKKGLNVEAGFGHSFTGQYVDESLANTGGSHDANDANWYYLQLIGSF